MENASKALLMAAGVLISLLIISSFVFMYNHLKSLPKTQEVLLEEEQLIEFNKQYESYNRRDLRGADVVSVINKAMDSNEKYGTEYYVNVTFKLKNGNIRDEIRLHESQNVNGKWQIREDTIYGAVVFENEIEYSIKDNRQDIENLINKIGDTTLYCDKNGNTSKGQKYYKENDVDKIYDREGNKYYTINSAFVEFKRKTFYCEKMEYTNSNTNIRRVCNIVFIEQ